jgi:PAS domain S-box-containing protein
MGKNHTDVQANKVTIHSIQNLSYLPSFAGYILAHRLTEFVEEQLRLSEELDLALLKQFSHLSREEFAALAREGATELLTYISQNKAEDYISLSMERWKTNQLPVMDKGAPLVQDITQVTYIRKQAFLHFAPQYCSDTSQVLELIKEIDLYLMHAETAATNTYIQLLRNRIDEHSYLIEKITNTSPGIIYVYDVLHNQEVYANRRLLETLGYEPEEFLALETSLVETLIHPEDVPGIREHERAFRNARDGEVRSVKYRMRNKNGEYRWLRTYETVFRRAEAGEITQKIGIAIDVHEQKITADQLRKREEELLEAQEIAQLGSFTWEFDPQKVTGSPQLHKIVELEEYSFEEFMQRVHPQDRKRVEEEMERSFTTGTYNCEFRYMASREKVLWSRGKVTYRDGKAIGMTGTIMDVSEQHSLLHRLRESEALYRQAEAITHIGNYQWNLATNEVHWSDELLRIHGLNPQTDQVTIDNVRALMHPDDRENVRSRTSEAIENKSSFDFYYRILPKGGGVKILRTQGRVTVNEDGAPGSIIGTVQDVTEKQQLITQLRQSDSLYKQAQALAQLGNWTMDLRTREYTWSDEMYHIYELPEKDHFSFEEWTNFIHPDEREEVLAYLNECIKKKQPYQKIHRVVLRNGKVKILDRRGEFICNDAGEPVTMIGTTQDVTAQQQIQQELKENQTFIQKIADATPSIIASYNVNSGQYLFVSEGLRKLLGYDPNLALQGGIPFFVSLLHPDDLPGIMEKNTQALEEANRNRANNDLVIEFTYRMRHQNGEYRWFNTYGTIFDRNAQGHVEHILNISLDVTEQVEASHKIKEQEHFIQQIADASPTILYLFDAAHNQVAYMNREAFFVLGYTPEEILAMGSAVTTTLYHPEDIELLPERRESPKKFQHLDSMMQYECRMKTRDGAYKWMLVREIIFKTDEEGRVLQTLGAALDISQRKEMEQTILQNSFQLQQSNASLEEFAYVASHDLKEPLRKISTFGDRLVNTQQDQLTPDGKVYLNKIIDASQRMQTMISDLLTVSMITGDRSFQQLSLKDILQDVLQTLEFKIEQKGAEIQATELPEAHIIPSQFRQLFQNLLSNSLKFTREDVQPVIQITHRHLPPESLAGYQLAKAGQYLELTFKDNGIGFEDEYAGKIFAIFQRLHGRSEYEGTGIGLAICKKIVEHHGGIISASGVPGKGASFTIILPA